MAALELDDPSFGPALLEGAEKQEGVGLSLELPLPVYSRVLFIVDAAPPHGPVPVSYRARHKGIPPRSRCVALDLNAGIEVVMHGKGKYLRCFPEEPTDRFSALEPAQVVALPERVLGEKLGDLVRVVVVVAVRSLLCFQVAYGVGIL